MDISVEKTIPEILFEEFRDGKVYSKQEYSILSQWARFRNADNIILVLKKHSDGFNILELRMAWLKEEGEYDDSSFYQFAKVSEGWRNLGSGGSKMRKAVIYRIETYYPLEITSRESDAALTVINRAQELTREYVVEEKWSGACLEKP